MLITTEACPFISTPRPHSFMGLMEMYEVNYMRIRQLCPGINELEGHAVSVVKGALDLHLRVQEQTTYTTTVLLTYYLQEAQHGFKPNPNLKVRIYNDARQAEVLSRSYRRFGLGMKVNDLSSGSELASKWRLNRFLYKWLSYCRFQGHCFYGHSIAIPSTQMRTAITRPG